MINTIEENKDWFNYDTRRDVKDHRLWRKYKVRMTKVGAEIKEADSRLLEEWKLSRFFVTESQLVDGYEVYKNGGDISKFNPKLLFFIQKIAEKQKDFACIKFIAGIAKERRKNAEFDSFGDWLKTDAPLL
mgnify:CR=1 FL=1